MSVHKSDINLALALADAAGAAIRPYFRREMGLEIKADNSPVTLADREAEAAMRRILEAERSGDGIHGEEYGVKDGVTGRQWVLDPIDGTRSFTVGRPIFGTLIALVDNGWPVLGIIDQPIAGERWLGVMGRPTLFNGQPARTRPCAALEGATIATTSPHLFEDEDVPHYMALVTAISGQSPRQGPVYGGDCYNYALLAGGYCDLVIETGLHPYDYLPVVQIVQSAGGVITDWSGAPLHTGSGGAILASATPELHEQALARIAAG